MTWTVIFWGLVAVMVGGWLLGCIKEAINNELKSVDIDWSFVEAESDRFRNLNSRSSENTGR